MKYTDSDIANVFLPHSGSSVVCEARNRGLIICLQTIILRWPFFGTRIKARQDNKKTFGMKSHYFCKKIGDGTSDLKHENVFVCRAFIPLYF